jgi:hypothetical protein
MAGEGRREREGGGKEDRRVAGSRRGGQEGRKAGEGRRERERTLTLKGPKSLLRLHKLFFFRACRVQHNLRRSILQGLPVYPKKKLIKFRFIKTFQNF